MTPVNLSRTTRISLTVSYSFSVFLVSMKSNVMISEFGKLASEGSPECSMVLHFCSDA